MARVIGPLPANLRSDVNMTLGMESFANLDDSQRNIIRSLVWVAYEEGFTAGRVSEREDSWTDREVKRDQDAARAAALKRAEGAKK